MRQSIHRIQSHLARLSSQYPKCWQALDGFRQAKGQGLEDWPDWCYVPVAACYAVVSHTVSGGERINDLESLADVGLMHALAGWRLTQGIYRFDPDIYQELTSTPFTGQMPIEILYSLPEWSVFIELQEDYAHGVWATLEHDVNEHHSELRLIFDTPAGIMPQQIHLVGTLEEGIQAAIDFADKHHKPAKLLQESRERTEFTKDIAMPVAKSLGEVVSLVLYLCSQKPDLEAEGMTGSRPARPNPVKTKKGYRYFPAKKTTIWQTGYRLGEFLRESKGSKQTDQGGSHASPAPHVRRTHWHTYWTGPRKNPNRRRPVLKWIPPTPVGFEWEEGGEEIGPVVKRVK